METNLPSFGFVQKKFLKSFIKLPTRNEKSSSFFFAPKMEKIDVLKDEINSHWKWVIGGIILVVVIVLWINREKFGIGAPLIENPLPFTSGASLRVQSEDSATNRGFNDTWA